MAEKLEVRLGREPLGRSSHTGSPQNGGMLLDYVDHSAVHPTDDSRHSAFYSRATRRRARPY